ncbi:monothiol glutaredoxin-S15, mitochondrial [Selaginella moellendorffii]|uniref:monothiol glutaredoxin-S15, mitochondrial n=1 Tax=Selaginella moellendorffii TaxID=88036 RepID=UPI000D1C787E|nr:monothiol glutaredoxin-S15, mitochondrial [Selaginella moellendorffii]|eukprot:XP_002992600.2 monothiol glutaredoxin-S15, mitochondrial [Selaginella moellendorffii]
MMKRAAMGAMSFTRAAGARGAGAWSSRFSQLSTAGRDTDAQDDAKAAALKAPARDDAESHDDFKPVVKTPSGSVHDTIEKDIKENPVMVYMKGIPDAPQCGFSAMVVRILKHYEVPFSSRNVLEDPELRDGVKSFSKWPTVPQLYIRGEFVGGCDIVTDMHRNGQLKEKLKDVKPDL